MEASINQVAPEAIFLEETDLRSARTLQKGIILTEEVKQMLIRNVSQIISCLPVDGITLHATTKTHRVFSIGFERNYIFKISRNVISTSSETSSSDISPSGLTPNERTDPYPCRSPCYTIAANIKFMQMRFQNMVRAQRIVDEGNLHLLVIPHAAYFTLELDRERIELIVEEKLNIGCSKMKLQDSSPESLHEVTPTIEQLTHFICQTGFSDVAWRNIPIINERERDATPKRIGLIDL